MTISLEMLAAAGRGKTLLGDLAATVGRFFQEQLLADGGFADRAGASDLYYTVFGLQGLRAIGLPVPADRVAGYLRRFGVGEGLDLVHLSCLARCWISLPESEPPAGLAEEVLGRLASRRCADGGYTQHTHAETGSAYGCFLALGICQDLLAELPDPDGVIACLHSLRTPDGAYANDRNLPIGSVPATAAAVTALHHLRRPAPADVADWLLDQHCRTGGFLAVPIAPEPDLLSTATALHALSLLAGDVSDIRRRCAEFVRGLQTPGGSFAGHVGDPAPDGEYTFYALLALGHLA